MATGQLGYVYPGTPSHLQPVKTTKPPSSNNSSAPSTPPPQAANCSFFVNDSMRVEIQQKNALTLTQPDIVRFPDLPNEVDNYHELCPLEPIHKPASTVLGYQTSTYKATSIKTGTRYCLRRIHGEFQLHWQMKTIGYRLLGNTVGLDVRRFSTCQLEVYGIGRHVEAIVTYKSRSAERSLHY